MRHPTRDEWDEDWPVGVATSRIADMARSTVDDVYENRFRVTDLTVMELGPTYRWLFFPTGRRKVRIMVTLECIDESCPLCRAGEN